MKFYIHSSFGILEATPMTVQAIEKSISEQAEVDANKDTEASEDVQAD